MKKLKQIIMCLLMAVLLAGALPGHATEAASPKLSASKITLAQGESKTLKVTGTSSKVTWKSSKKSVATVNAKGKVTAKKKGTATITATVGSKKLTCKVTVKVPKLNKTSLKLEVNEVYSLKITGTSQKAKWSSSNKSVATVTNKGKVTAKKKGSATITAKVGSKKYTCKVTVTGGSNSDPVMVSKYTTLKNYIKFNGNNVVNGNKCIQFQNSGTTTSGVPYTDTYRIEYNTKKDQLIFLFQSVERLNGYNYTTLIQMDVDVPKNANVSPEYSLFVNSESLKAKATFKAASYKKNSKVSFKITGQTSNLTDAEIQKTTNNYLQLAFSGWQALVRRAGLTLKDIGFTSYK